MKYLITLLVLPLLLFLTITDLTKDLISWIKKKLKKN
jgi:hypothetical protein